MPPRSVTKWLEIATAQKLRPLWANEFKDVLVRAKVNDIVAARDRDSFSEPWRRVLLKKVSKTTWLLLDENGKALDEPDCPCSGFTEKSLLEEAGMDYYDFPFDDVPPCATSPSATNDDKDEDDALCAAVDAFVQRRQIDRRHGHRAHSGWVQGCFHTGAQGSLPQGWS